MRFCIVGTGWYGCHAAAYLLKMGHHVTIIDRNESFFSGASSKNQNRLHLGFHYPRSEETIHECQLGFPLFMQDYGQFTSEVPMNLYFIHNNSKVTFDSYSKMFLNDRELLDSNSLPFTIKNVHGTCMRVNERFIDNTKATRFFTDKLSSYFKKEDAELFELYDTHVIMNDISYDYLLNCTNNQWTPIPLEYDITYENYCSLLYHIPFGVTTGITIMDGHFFSIYPYDIQKNIYTVTHVHYGVLNKTDKCCFENMVIESIEPIKSKIEYELAIVLPELFKQMMYVGYFVSTKTKYDYTTDDRSLRTFRKGRYLSFSGGKITGIFSMESILHSLVS